MKCITTFLLSVIACVTIAQRNVAQTPSIAPAERAGETAARRSTMHVDLSDVKLETPSDRLLVNLMMEGRLAWFSWMNRP